MTRFLLVFTHPRLRAFSLLLLLGLALHASGQNLTLTGLNPARNARSAPPTTDLAATFSQPLASNSASLSGLRLFSAQRGGLLVNGRGGSASVSGNTLVFNPATDFRPGETIFVTSTTAIQGTTGNRLSRGQVFQFTTGVGGPGRGNFMAPATNPEVAVGDAPYSVALGDVDGDGDLDLLSPSLSRGTVSIRLNNGAGSFTTPSYDEVGVGGRPASVALGDVDGDGDLDLVTANSNSSTVSVRINFGGGIFSPLGNNSEVVVGGDPVSVALGDVDGDGDLDLLCANRSDNFPADIALNTVSVRLNDGSGNFMAPATNPEVGVGMNPFSVALGDLDGDGDLDFVTANTNSNTVSVRRNDGAGNFTPPAPNGEVGVGGSPRSVALGDVDGDGDLDLVTANNGNGTVSVLLNNGGGSFSQPATNPNPGVVGNPYSVALGDVDGDGDLDFVTANPVAKAVSVRLNNGSGNFTPPATNSDPGVGSDPYSVALGDVDGDGDLDFVTANANSSTVSVRLNRPLLPLTLTGLSPARNARSAPPTTDLAATFSQPLASNSASLSGLRLFSAQRGGLLVNGRGGSASVSGNTLVFNPATDFRPGETILVTGTTAIQSTDNVRLSRGQVFQFTTGVGGNGRGNFMAPATNPEVGVGNRPTSVALGDVDGDGDLDLLSANSNSATVSIRLNNGSGSFTPPTVTNPDRGVGDAPVSLALGDVDGDGDLDFVTANYYGATVSVRVNNGAGNFTQPATNPNPGVGGSPVSVALGDVDGDGDLDLLCANAGSVSIRLNNGSGSFSPPATNPEVGVGSDPRSVVLGDVDGDGDLDFVTANNGNSTVSVRLNDGSGNFTPPATNPNPLFGGSPRSVALGMWTGTGIWTCSARRLAAPPRVCGSTMGRATSPSRPPIPTLGLGLMLTAWLWGMWTGTGIWTW